MSYLFFSYSRSDTGNRFLQQFFTDLVAEVRQKVGTFSSAESDREVIYLDTAEPVGGQWEPDLVANLQGCRALVCVYSASYFNSEYCGKEFALFQSRLVAASPQNPPPLMFPVLWDMNDRVRTAIASKAPSIQYTHQQFAQMYEEEGLCYLMRLHRDEYQAFLHYFTKMLVDAVENQKVPIPPLNTFPDLCDIESAWKATHGPLTHAPIPGDLEGAGTTRFFFVAGSGSEYVQVRQHVGCYNFQGGRFWAPYHPAVNDQVSFISYRAAGHAQANYKDLPVTDQLIQQIQDAEDTNTIVLLVVDPWSVKVQTFRDLLEEFDSHAFLNCGIVITWNAQDGEPESEHIKLRQDLSAAFKRVLRLRHMYYRDSVASASDLEKELCKAILEIRSRLMQQATEVRSAEPIDLQANSLRAMPIIQAPVGGLHEP
jgi:FxsC-like protein